MTYPLENRRESPCRVAARRLIDALAGGAVRTLGLYRSAGVEHISRFGVHLGSPLSVCLGKTLVPRTPERSMGV